MAKDYMHMFGQLALGLEALTRAIESLQTEVREQSQRHNTFATRFVAIEGTLTATLKVVEKLNEVVRDGNGQPSLQHQLIAVREQLRHVAADMGELAKSVDNFQTAKVMSRGQVWGGIAGAVLAAVLAAAAIIAEILKR